MRGFRVTCMATIVAAFLAIGVATPANAILTTSQLDQIRAAVKQNSGPAVISALRALFKAHPNIAPEIAATAVELNPSLCRACAIAAASSVPEQAFAIAKAMVGEAPECANDVIEGMSKELPEIAEMVADVVSKAVVQSSAGPADPDSAPGRPISSPTDTSESGSDNRASPSG